MLEGLELGMGGACTAMVQLQTNSKAGQMPVGGVATLSCLQGEPLGISSRSGAEASRGSTKETGWGVQGGLGERVAAWEALP